MIVSTCNRVEILAAVEDPEVQLTGFLSDHFGIDPSVLGPHLYEYATRRRSGICFAWQRAWTRWWWASRRFWPGERGIAAARAAGTVGGQLEHLLQSAFAAAKRARSETASARIRFQSPQWPSTWRARSSDRCRAAPCSWLERQDERDCRAPPGAAGAGAILVTNRTHERARRMAEEFQGSVVPQVVPFEQVYEAAGSADIVISSTGAPHHIFRASTAGLPASPSQPSHVLHRYRRPAGRGSGDEQAGRHICLRHRRLAAGSCGAHGRAQPPGHRRGDADLPQR